jgi:hypothetical protein
MSFSDYEYKLSKNTIGRIERDCANNWIWRIFTNGQIFSSNNLGDCFKKKRECKSHMIEFFEQNIVSL